MWRWGHRGLLLPLQNQGAYRASVPRERPGGHDQALQGFAREEGERFLEHEVGYHFLDS